jgi:hypothetical protein
VKSDENILPEIIFITLEIYNVATNIVNGIWEAFIWKGDGVDSGFLDKAVNSIGTTMDDQVSHTIKAHNEGSVPDDVVNCNASQTFSNFTSSLENTGNYRDHSHHLLVVDCLLDESNFIPGIFYSSSGGRLSIDILLRVTAEES